MTNEPFKEYTMNPVKISLLLIFAMSNFQLNASELTDYLNNLHTFKANFSQFVFSASKKEQQKSQGTIIVKSPDKFYLEYTQPYKTLYVADGEKLWSYDEDLEQVVVKAQGDLLINTPAMLLGNPNDLTKSYFIENKGMIEGLLWFELTPKKDDGNFESVSLVFDKAELIAMEMRDNFGQVTRLGFSNVEKNLSLTTNQFKFIPPKDVDVIGQ